jgi:hypothetical protein
VGLERVLKCRIAECTEEYPLRTQRNTVRYLLNSRFQILLKKEKAADKSDLNPD